MRRRSRDRRQLQTTLRPLSRRGPRLHRAKKARLVCHGFRRRRSRPFESRTAELSHGRSCELCYNTTMRSPNGVAPTPTPWAGYPRDETSAERTPRFPKTTATNPRNPRRRAAVKSYSLPGGASVHGEGGAPSTVRPLVRNPRVLIGWPLPLGFGLGGCLLLARRGRVYRPPHTGGEGEAEAGKRGAAPPCGGRMSGIKEIHRQKTPQPLQHRHVSSDVQHRPAP